MPKIHVALSEDVHRQLRVKVALEDETIQDYVEGLVTRAVKDIRVDATRKGRPGRNSRRGPA